MDGQFAWKSVLGALGLVVASLGAVEPRETLGEEYPSLEFLESGLSVRESAPKGWSLLVVKSLPRLESGDLDTLPKFAKQQATRFRTVILLEHRGGNTPGEEFRFRRVGMGLCLPLEGGDVTMATGSSLAREVLGLIDRQVLDQAEQVLRQARLVVAQPRFCLLQAPSIQRIGKAHVAVKVHYAFVLDPASGAISSLVWSLPTDPTEKRVPLSLRVLRGNLVYPCGIDVEAHRLLGSVPVSWSFAMNDLPPGEALAVDREAASWIGHPSRPQEDPVEFERWIRRLIAQSDPSSRE